jgi:NAD(P)-dependent dehydrogenase (short-subunit alcohol dehydrogenase family)
MNSSVVLIHRHHEGQPGPVTDQTAESYAVTLDTSALGTTGHRGSPGASVYTAGKHAVEGLTKAAAGNEDRKATKPRLSPDKLST